ncbi:hypothetical protein FA15DRAFT_662522 [Coprinopsis marcescibilis]|uniref:M protein, serotype 2.1 n=1 Tax=Coprinopsis marcescibilis TaxID=230819 RepID=A0A5C3LCG8_COPMA|nr:hypothetical protein FA15DRAFT_662522 [Coprinopsis marcescibilis]
MSTVSPKPAITKRSTASPTASPPAMRGTGTARQSSLATPVPRRRPPSKVISTPQSNGDTRDATVLKQETDKNEQLLLQVQDKEQTIGALTTENNNISSALNAAETRLAELYAEQSRWEMELAQRIEVAEKLREQLREVEKEKRDVQRRYNEQTATFDAERQSFYDNEQHLKSRIQSLSQARKRAETISKYSPPAVEETFIKEEPKSAPLETAKSTATQPDYNDPDNEPVEMTALKLELSTLSTSYASMQSTLLMLQSQLVDLKRVNQGLQEENESYMILLREKTLSGQFDLMKQVGGTSGSSDDEDDEDDHGKGVDDRSLHSIGRSTLDRVEEEPEASVGKTLESEFADLDVSTSPRSSRQPSRQGRKRTSSSAAPRGESLADLPITGPGLDLAAELGRAENKDILDGNFVDVNVNVNGNQPGSKRLKKSSIKASEEEDIVSANIDALRSEVKSLKDANKALSLYASKILDRIIAQDGFEHVLAADYEQEPKTPSVATPAAPPKASPLKPRPQSVFISRTPSSPAPATPTKATTPRPSAKANRRSLSFDWKTFSFSTEPKPEPASSNLRPLTLKPGASPVVTGGRKLETQEDDEDRRERERLAATMKLMGIQPQTSVHTGPLARAENRSDSPSRANRRVSLWGGRKDSSDAASLDSRRSTDSSRIGLGHGSNLTQEALEQVEAQNSLAALDARERNLTDEIAKGSSGGFTEIAPRGVGRRSRRSAGGSGSGSTVFSAGMSADGDEEKR